MVETVTIYVLKDHSDGSVSYQAGARLHVTAERAAVLLETAPDVFSRKPEKKKKEVRSKK